MYKYAVRTMHLTLNDNAILLQLLVMVKTHDARDWDWLTMNVWGKILQAKVHRRWEYPQFRLDGSLNQILKRRAQ
jgi:hypothetical protein